MSSALEQDWHLESFLLKNESLEALHKVLYSNSEKLQQKIHRDLNETPVTLQNRHNDLPMTHLKVTVQEIVGQSSKSLLLHEAGVLLFLRFFLKAT